MGFKPAELISIVKTTRWWRNCLTPLSNTLARTRLGVVVADEALYLSLVKIKSGKLKFIDGQKLIWPETKEDIWVERAKVATAAIVELLRRHNRIKVPINLAFRGREIGLRRETLPSMPISEVDQAVQWESDRLFPFDINQCLVDHELVKQVTPDFQGQIAVNITAVNRDLVKEFTERFCTANLNLGRIGYLPSCIVESLRSQKLWTSKAISLILFLDEGQSMAIFVGNGFVELYQEFITQPLDSPLRDGSLQNLDAIMEELTSFIELFAAQGQGANVDNIFLAGQYASSNQLQEELKQRFELPVQAIDQFGWWPSTTSGISDLQVPQLSIAILTAAAAPIPSRLLPEETFIERQKKQMIASAVAASLITVVAIALFWISDVQTEKSLRQNLQGATQAVSAIESSSAYSTYLAMTNKLAASGKMTNEEKVQRKALYSALLKEMSLLVPEELHLNSMYLSIEQDRKYFGIEGSVKESDVSPEITLARFVRNLDKSPFFTQAQVLSHNRINQHGIDQINFLIKMEVTS